MLTVVKQAGWRKDKKGRRGRTWLCKCDCGGEKIVNANRLGSKWYTKSCGCIASLKSELVGKRFGRLTVIGKGGRDSTNRKMWLCKCDCGGEKAIRGSSLLYGASKSCGCARVKTYRKRGRAKII